MTSSPSTRPTHSRSRTRLGDGLAHQAWHHDQVLLISYDDRLTLAVPGHEFSADLVLAALFRFAKAVGGRPDRMTAALRLGAVGRAMQ